MLKERNGEVKRQDLDSWRYRDKRVNGVLRIIFSKSAFQNLVLICAGLGSFVMDSQL